VYHDVLYQSMLSTCSEWIRIYCPRGQSVSRYVVLVYSVHVVRVSHNMLYQSTLSECLIIYCPMWSGCITICCINPCGLHGQNETAHIAHVVRVYHDMLYQSVRSTWSEWNGAYCPCGQGVSRYIALIHIVHVVIMDLSPCGQSVSRYVVSIHCVYMVSMYRDIFAPCGQSVSRYICPVWSAYLIIIMRRCDRMLSCVQVVSSYIASHRNVHILMVAMRVVIVCAHARYCHIVIGATCSIIRYHALARFNRLYVVSVSSVRQAVHLSTHRLNGTSTMGQVQWHSMTARCSRPY